MTAQPFIVMCAPNGARKTRADHPALPLTPAELAQCAASIASAGASMMHLHVRDDDGRHSLDPDRYRAAVDAIRDRVGDQLVLQVTTEACGVYTAAQQMAVVRELVPEAVSVALREICPDDAALDEAAGFYSWMTGARVFAQHILYSAAEVERFRSLRDAGVIPDERPFVLFVLGRYSESLTGDVAEIDAFVEAATTDIAWSVCCFGKTEPAAVRRAAELGGHARVGFENNLHGADGSVARDNAALVRDAVKAGEAAGRRIATAMDVREQFFGP